MGTLNSAPIFSAQRLAKRSEQVPLPECFPKSLDLPLPAPTPFLSRYEISLDVLARLREMCCLLSKLSKNAIAFIERLDYPFISTIECSEDAYFLATVDVRHTCCWNVAKTRSNVYIPNLLEPDQAGFFVPEWEIEQGARCYLSAPIFIRHRVLGQRTPQRDFFGTLCLIHSIPHAFSDEILRLHSLFASEIENELSLDFAIQEPVTLDTLPRGQKTTCYVCESCNLISLTSSGSRLTALDLASKAGMQFSHDVCLSCAQTHSNHPVRTHMAISNNSPSQDEEDDSDASLNPAKRARVDRAPTTAATEAAVSSPPPAADRVLTPLPSPTWRGSSSSSSSSASSAAPSPDQADLPSLSSSSSSSSASSSSSPSPDLGAMSPPRSFSPASPSAGPEPPVIAPSSHSSPRTSPPRAQQLKVFLSSSSSSSSSAVSSSTYPSAPAAATSSTQLTSALNPALVPAHPLRVLVVDDSSALLTIFSRLLTLLGHHCSTCTSGENGILEYEAAAKKKQAYDLVLLDIIMPGLDGIQVLTRIKAVDMLLRQDDSSFKPAPVFAVTGVQDPEEHQRFLQAGFAEIMVKPLRILPLQEMIHKYFDE